MATYAIGDVQGCYRSLMALLTQIGWAPERDRIWLLGDLVNRGPGSLEVLRFAVKNDSSVSAVVGNHDLHLLSRVYGVSEEKLLDTLGDVLAAPDRTTLVEWLRHRPVLAHASVHASFVHAGLLPAWSMHDADELARESEGHLRGKDVAQFLQARRTAKRLPWTSELSGRERALVALTVFTGVRTCTPDGQMDHNYKGDLEHIPAGLTPWFAHPARRSLGTEIYFGHWSALGFHRGMHAVCLDSGCVWGRELTAVRLDDGKLYTQPSLDAVRRA